MICMFVILQLATQSQELYDHNLSLQENVHTLEKAAASDRSRLTTQLVKELTMCVQELQQLVELCSQRAEGQEPNVSLLLGFRCKFFSLSVCLFVICLFVAVFVCLFATTASCCCAARWVKDRSPASFCSWDSDVSLSLCLLACLFVCFIEI